LLSVTKASNEEILFATLPVRVKSGRYIAPKMGAMVITTYRPENVFEGAAKGSQLILSKATKKQKARFHRLFERKNQIPESGKIKSL
jgi:hypothetical protein